MSASTSPPGSGRTSWAERAGHWLSDESLTWLLLLLIADLFVLPTFDTGLGQTAANLMFTILLFTGLATVANRGLALVAVGALVLGAVALKWAGPDSGLPGVPAMAAGAGVIVFAVFTLLVLLRTLSPGPITRQRIEGAIAVYLLIAVTFAGAFELLELVRPGSLQFTGSALKEVRHPVGYFSVVTLTTVGYGDVTPVGPLARRLAALEGLIGQLYPAIIIGWMIGSMRRRED
jgi:membrane-bound ClpP family serine protease